MRERLFAACLSGYSCFVLRFGEIIVRTSDTILPWIFRLSLPLFLLSSPKSFQACGLFWGGAVASGDHPLAYPRV